MPKRMIDTDLWDDDDIIADFTAEDRYFWLYLLTNPHNKMCGVLKNSPSLIARDMGLHKDTIVNLIYRFERVHNRIYCDSKTKEILILSWYKYNWTKSPKIISIISREKADIKSKKIISLIDERLSNLFNSTEEKENEKEIEEEKNDDTLSIGYRYPTNSNTNTNSISNIFNHWNTKDIIVHKELSIEMSKAIEKALTIYSEDDIKTYIDRYAKVLNCKDYFWHYKWSLKDFLNRKEGVSSFTDEGSKWQSYQDFVNKNQNEMSSFDTDDFFKAALERSEQLYKDIR